MASSTGLTSPPSSLAGAPVQTDLSQASTFKFENRFGAKAAPRPAATICVRAANTVLT